MLLGLEQDRGGAAVRLDEDACLNGFAAGAHSVRLDMNGDLQVVRDLEVLLGDAGLAE
ncbi:hypothetical protein D3C83_266880 [compost metagenome]